MKIIISDRAEVYDERAHALDTNPETLRKLSGLACTEGEMSEFIGDGSDEGLIADIGIAGGTLTFTYVPETNELRVVTEYEAPRKLTKKELDVLVKYTTGQWSDGMGENFTNDYAEKTGMLVHAYPLSGKQGIRVEQVDAGKTKAKRPSPLLTAAKSGEIKKIAKLLEQGEEINTRNKWGQTPLRVAILAGQTQAALYLIEKGADVNTTDGEGWTPLHSAALNGNRDVAIALLDKGAEINTRGYLDMTALMWAANRGHPEVLKMLLERNADVNLQDSTGRSALLSAKDPEMIRLLLEHGADTGLKDYAGRTAIDEARARKDEEALNLLLKYSDRP